MMKYSRDKFEAIARDLLHLEITLVSHPFADRIKAPDPASQLADLAQSYSSEIDRSRSLFAGMGTFFDGEELAAFESADAAPLESTKEAPLSTRASFERIIKNAEQDITTLQAIKRMGGTLEFEGLKTAELSSAPLPAKSEIETDAGDPLRLLTTQEQTLLRIRDNAKQISTLMDDMEGRSARRLEAGPALAEADKSGLRDLQWDPQSIMQIRKLWEVRPQDVILMRTVIGMDGDVVAHVNPVIAGQEFSYLHRLHDQSVAVSVGFWKELIGILSDFITILVDKIFGR